MSTHPTLEPTDLPTPEVRAADVRGGEDLSELKQSTQLALQAASDAEQQAMATLTSIVKATGTTTTSLVRRLG